MRPGFYRMDIDEDEFRNHARDSYEIGNPIDPTAIKHPVWVLEAALMNYEVWSQIREIRHERGQFESLVSEEDTA